MVLAKLEAAPSPWLLPVIILLLLLEVGPILLKRLWCKALR
jgi:hypothetical protein